MFFDLKKLHSNSIKNLIKKIKHLCFNFAQDYEKYCKIKNYASRNHDNLFAQANANVLNKILEKRIETFSNDKEILFVRNALVKAAEDIVETSRRIGIIVDDLSKQEKAEYAEPANLQDQ